MNLKDLLRSDYFILFVKREGKVVLGKHYSNLWLLFGVLLATFFAISFSNASMDYLDFKMNDPFINWVDIKNEHGEDDFLGLESALASDEIKERYHYNDYQADYYYNYNFWGADGSIHYFRCRFFEKLKDNSLIDAILSEDNLVNGWGIEKSRIGDKSFGLIMTEDALKKLGYEDAPAFIDYCRYGTGADTLGFDVNPEGFAKVPLPLLGVVKRLPGNIDVISTKYLYEQDNNANTQPLHLNKVSYASSLYYFLPEGSDAKAFVAELDSLAGSTFSEKYILSVQELPLMNSYKPGVFVSFRGVYGDLAHKDVMRIHEGIYDEYAPQGVCRVFDYNVSEYELMEEAFLSVYFNDLDVIRDFETYVKNEFKVSLEMSQINAKENFNAVSLLANILSWSMIIFAIVCIILFIVNLLQSYFQKVKRNLGTFKAFGISNSELISVYVLIMVATVLAAIAMSLSCAYIVEIILKLAGVLKDGNFSYLTLWSAKTIGSVIIIITASVSTVYLVMRNLLKTTPGDLIYDR